MDANFTIVRKSMTNNQLDQDKLSIMPCVQDDLQLHNHDFFELAYITGGTSWHTLNGVSSRLAKGNYFIVDYGARHSYAQSQNLTLINCLFLPEIIDTTLADCNSFSSLIHTCLLRYYELYSERNSANRVFDDEDGRILSLLTGMQQELADKKVGYQEILKNRLMEIIIITMRNIVDRHMKNVKTGITLNMLDYIHSHYQEHNLLSAFCEKTHYSPPYISRIFKQDSGFTVSEYLQKTRIEQSCKLLAGSQMSIAEVAEAVGYKDVKSFSTLFRKMIHQSPREYRKRASL